jgi:hypothetical protein
LEQTRAQVLLALVPIARWSVKDESVAPDPRAEIAKPRQIIATEDREEIVLPRERLRIPPTFGVALGDGFAGFASGRLMARQITRRGRR